MRLELAIVYRPCGSVLGLSKFTRIVDAHVHRLQWFVTGLVRARPGALTVPVGSRTVTRPGRSASDW
ncbi:hypothetical protein [Streptomyces griseoflavus]|uniref:hypothetical protein n=1 Tax=Streptomyces griseoflavus TaxID=35619 RepID=UPI00339F8A4E